MNKWSLVVVFGLFSGGLAAAPEIKGSPQELKGFLYPTDHVVTINGQAEKKAYSDQAIVSLVITTKNKLLSVAISENSALRLALTRSLRDSGISAGAIKSSKFSSSPQYGWLGKKPSSFQVVNRMAVTIEQEAHLNEIAKAADKYQEIELSDTAFEHTKKDEFNKKVKADALAKIIEQKEFYEKSLGVKLAPIGIRDSNLRRRATRGAMMLENVMVSAVRRERDSNSSITEFRAPKAEPSFDEIKYEANLAVDFKIEQQPPK